MKRVSSRIRIALSLALVAACTASLRADGPGSDLYARTLHGTALILTPSGSGTGWVIDLEQGLMVTNEHVVGKHEQVEVVFPLYGKNGRPIAEFDYYRRQARGITAEVVDVDLRHDLALLRLRDRPPDGVTPLKLAEEEPGPSEHLHSIGNPSASGALWVYSDGTVRQVYNKEWRYATGPLRSARVVETQSPINPGDSGGPVVNDAGELVAVVSGRQNDASLMGWCIAAAEVKTFVEETRPLLDPKTADAFHRRGLRALDRGILGKALDDLNEANKLDPKSAAFLVDRAQVHRARKDYELAIDDCNEALKLNPQHAGSYNVLGCIASDREDFDEALRDFLRAIHIAPRNAMFHANRAFAHVRKRQFVSAVRSYDEALRLTPGVAEWHYRRGLAFEQDGNVEKAEDDYRQALRFDPTYSERVIPHRTRAVQVVNRTGQKLKVSVRYETQSADGGWTWFPNEAAVEWEIPAGETATLLYQGRPILARRMRIWADGIGSKSVWHAVKDKDTWTAPSKGYRGGQQPEIFTYTFNP
jgi:tetratricopeptide (TPR) repeat protein